MHRHAELCQCPRGTLGWGPLPPENRRGCPKIAHLWGDPGAVPAPPAGDERYTVRQWFLFEGMFICFAYSRHENSSSYRPLFLCDTHPIIRVFRNTWDPLVP